MGEAEWNVFLSIVSGAAGGLSALILGLLAKHFFSGYFSEKGKLLATKEDIAEVTHKIEGVKALYVESQEARRFTNELRMASLDKRLQAHQDAFRRLRSLLLCAWGEQIESTRQVLACQAWWEENCLYLEPKARHAFVDAFRAVSDHQLLMQAAHGKTVETGAIEAGAAMEANLKRITDALDVMLEAVALPPLTDIEVTTSTPTPRATV